jgi:transcriptional regulator with XRE-family HTH domain
LAQRFRGLDLALLQFIFDILALKFYIAYTILYFELRYAKVPKIRISKTALPAQAVSELALLGERISIARRRRRLTQRQVARQTGLSRLSIINVEKGLPSVNIRKVMAISLAFDLESDWGKLFAAYEPTQEFQPSTLEARVPSLALQVGIGIRKARKQRNLTLADLAQALYVSPITIRRLEKEGESSLGLLAGILCCLDKHGGLGHLFDFKEDLAGQSLDYFRHQDRRKVRN